jgi:hypothetical protein
VKTGKYSPEKPAPPSKELEHLLRLSVFRKSEKRQQNEIWPAVWGRNRSKNEALQGTAARNSKTY